MGSGHLTIGNGTGTNVSFTLDGETYIAPPGNSQWDGFTATVGSNSFNVFGVSHVQVRADGQLGAIGQTTWDPASVWVLGAAIGAFVVLIGFGLRVLKIFGRAAGFAKVSDEG